MVAATVASLTSLQALARFIDRHERLFILTGAGCSTDSGIPDYRDTNGDWKRPQPIMLHAFLGDELARKRYWARSLAGFRRMRTARPNPAHVALAELERRHRLTMLVTQNVDGLHQAAGSRQVIDLHGRIDTVRCLGCERRTSRADLQVELERRNPGFAGLDAIEAPDGDADLAEVAFERFDVPACDECGGLIKPDVVFFGEGVPPERVRRGMTALDASDAMLVVGSSLMVYSGYRFAKACADAARPIAAINIGRTRADDLLTLKIAAGCAEVLAAALASPPEGANGSLNRTAWPAHPAS